MHVMTFSEHRRQELRLAHECCGQPEVLGSFLQPSIASDMFKVLHELVQASWHGAAADTEWVCMHARVRS